ncbi:MAG: TspO/MBR family protein [Candidatus Aenigmatarchaeota archaeon]
MSILNSKDILKLAASIGICLLAGVVGSIFTVSAIPSWYATLAKPFFAPPNWVFAPVWTTLYVLMGISLFLVWRKGFSKKTKGAIGIFGIQLALNVLWSLAFFGLKSPIAGLVVIVALWAAIAATIMKFMKISRNADLLLIPYIVWVSIAALLNFSIVLLNL